MQKKKVVKKLPASLKFYTTMVQKRSFGTLLSGTIERESVTTTRWKGKSGVPCV